MPNRQNIIELNGNRYDVSTGRLLPPKPVASQRLGSGSIDGVIRRGGKSTGRQSSHALTAASQSLKPWVPPVSHAVHAKTSPSKTLMRHAVRKPERPVIAHTLKQQPRLISPARLKRARQVAKSALINKFGGAAPPVYQRVAPLAVRAAPTNPAPARVEAAPPSPRPDSGVDPFATAIERATSHLEPKLKKTPRRHKLARKLRVSPRTLNAGAVLLAVLIIGAAVVYRSLPSINVSLAGSRAGIQASLPRHSPAGFKLVGPVEYSEGWVALNYRSVGDNRSFRLIQQKTDWNSQSLQANFVARQSDVRTVKGQGRIIFTYGGHNATWVNDGIWYKIEGSSALSYEQLLKIATSL